MSDDPIVEHRNLFSHCPFIQGQDVGNIPITDEDLFGDDQVEMGREDLEDLELEDMAPSTTTSTAGGGASAATERGTDEVGLRPGTRDINPGPNKGTYEANQVSWYKNQLYCLKYITRVSKRLFSNS